MSYKFSHPSLPKPPTKKLILKSPDRDAQEKYRRRWKECNEERFLRALEKFGSLQMRVKFELLEEDQEKKIHYRTISGKTLVFKRIPNQGRLLGIVDKITEAGVGICR